MRTSLPAFLFALLIILVIGCKNDLQILAPYQDVTVVYGLLDQNDSIHYIRINKAYQTAGNAYTAATQYDSINYPAGTLTVQLQDYSNGAIINTITLDTTSSVMIMPGIFSFPYELLYYTKQTLNPNDQYNLVITNNKTKKVITGSTSLLPDIYLTSPSGYMQNNTPIDLSSTTQFPTMISWNGTGTDAALYQLTLRFYYNEIDSVKKDTTNKYLDWVIFTLTSSGQTPVDFASEYFFQFVKESILPAIGNIKRVPLYIEIMFTTGSIDLNTYYQLSQPSLTVNQEKPFYTDLKNGVGIFTAKHTQYAHKTIGTNYVDSLVNIPGLNFKSH